MHHPPAVNTFNIADLYPWQAKQNSRTFIYVRGSLSCFGFITTSIAESRTQSAQADQIQDQVPH